MTPRPGAAASACTPRLAAETSAALVPALRVDGYGPHGWFVRGGARSVSIRHVANLPALRQAEVALAGQGREVARRPTCVPTLDVVEVRTAAKAPSARPVQALAAPAPADSRPQMKAGVNDNQASRSFKGSFGRRIARELFFLVLLAVTIAGVYQIGRMHALQRIISVPDTQRPGARVT